MKIKSLTIIRVGLAFAFMANALPAFIAPQEFAELINSSFISGMLPISVLFFITLIGVNDALIAVLLFSGGRRARIIEWWAAGWLVGVLVIKATGGNYLDSLEEIAFLAMAIALSFQGKPERK